MTTSLFEVSRTKAPPAPPIPRRNRTVALIAPLCVTAPMESSSTFPLTSMPATSKPPSSRKVTPANGLLFASSVPTRLFGTARPKAPSAPAVPSRVSVVALIAPLCDTAALASSVTPPLALMPATSNPSSSRKLTEATGSLSASSVLTALFDVPRSKAPFAPPVPSSVRVVALMAPVCVTAPSESSVTAPLASMPATVKPLSSRKVTVARGSVPASSVRTALLNEPKAKPPVTPPVPSSVSVVALIAALWVTVPALSKVTGPLTVIPIPRPVTSNPLSSRKLSVEPMTWSEATSLDASVSVYAPPPSRTRIPEVVMGPDCSIDPDELRLTAPVAVIPATVKPVLSLKVTEASTSVSASSVVTSLKEPFIWNVPPVPVRNSVPAVTVSPAVMDDDAVPEVVTVRLLLPTLS